MMSTSKTSTAEPGMSLPRENPRHHESTQRYLNSRTLGQWWHQCDDVAVIVEDDEVNANIQMNALTKKAKA